MAASALIRFRKTETGYGDFFGGVTLIEMWHKTDAVLALFNIIFKTMLTDGSFSP